MKSVKNMKQSVNKGVGILKKDVSNFLRPFLFGLLFSIIFSIIEYFLLLVTEETMTKFLEKDVHNIIILTMIKATISSVLSLFIVNFIEKKIFQRNFNIMRNPFIDSLGIIVGSFIVIFVYYIIINRKKKN
jgi:uncharacterized protein YacL